MIGKGNHLKYTHQKKNVFTRGCTKKCTKVILHTTKMIDPRVKSQANGQNNGSVALK